MAAEIHVGDIGTIFRATLTDDAGIVDVSGATSKAIILFDADGNSTSHAASFFTDGSDGILQYTTVAGDLDIAGQWAWEVHIAFGGGTSRWASDDAKFQVHSPLRAQGT